MTEYKYVIVGAGMTAHAAVLGIRSVDKQGSIAVFGDEPDGPYKRPPLTKDLWKGKPLDSIWYETEKLVTDLTLSSPVTSIDPSAKEISTRTGLQRYEKLLIATGGTPRRLPADVEGIIYYRTAEDYRVLRAQADSRNRFAVIGGGFIGSEIAASLAMNGKKVVMIFPEPTVTSRVLPKDLAEFVTDYFREKGVEVLAQSKADSMRRSGDHFDLTIHGPDGNEHKTSAGAIIAGIGITPNDDLARDAGLEVTDGIVVDEYLRTSATDVFAAGDVANFIDANLGVRRRVEHEDNAKAMGKAAGQTMAGKETKYDHLPFFYSDLFDLGYEAVGELDARLETYSDWQEQFRKGVIYYLREGRVRGVLLWNVWDQVDAARRLIAEPGPFNAENLKGRLPVRKNDK